MDFRTVAEGIKVLTDVVVQGVTVGAKGLSMGVKGNAVKDSGVVETGVSLKLRIVKKPDSRMWCAD